MSQINNDLTKNPLYTDPNAPIEQGKNLDGKVSKQSLESLSNPKTHDLPPSLFSSPLLDAPLFSLAALQVLAAASVTSLEGMRSALNVEIRKNSVAENKENLEAQAKIDAQAREENIHKLINLIVFLGLPDDINLVEIANQANIMSQALSSMLDHVEWADRVSERNNNAVTSMRVHMGGETLDDGTVVDKNGNVVDENKHSEFTAHSNFRGYSTELTYYIKAEKLQQIFGEDLEGEMNIPLAMNVFAEIYNISDTNMQLLQLMMEAGARATGTIASFFADSEHASTDEVFAALFGDSMSKLLPLALLKGSSTLSDLEFASVVLDIDLETLSTFDNHKTYKKIMEKFYEDMNAMFTAITEKFRDFDHDVHSRTYIDTDAERDALRKIYSGSSGASYDEIQAMRAEAHLYVQQRTIAGIIAETFDFTSIMLNTMQELANHRIESEKSMANILLARALV